MRAFDFFDYSKDKDKELALLFLFCLKAMNKADEIADNEGEPFILPAGSFITNYSDLAHHMKSSRRKITADLDRLQALGLVAVNNFPEKGYTFRYTFPNTFKNTFRKVVSVSFQDFSVKIPDHVVQKLVHFSEHKSEHFSEVDSKIPVDSPQNEWSPPHTPPLSSLETDKNIPPKEKESYAFLEKPTVFHTQDDNFFSKEEPEEKYEEAGDNNLSSQQEESEEEREQALFDALGGNAQTGFEGLTETVVKPKSDQTKVQSPEQQRNIERALWRDGLWHFCRYYYLESGLNQSLYPKLSPAMNGILNRTIDKLGSGDWVLGVKWVMVYIVAAKVRFDSQKNQGYNGTYWAPTLDNLMQNKKIFELQNDAAEYDLPEIADNAKEFRDRCRMDTDLFEKNLTGGLIQ